MRQPEKLTHSTGWCLSPENARNLGHGLRVMGGTSLICSPSARSTLWYGDNTLILIRLVGCRAWVAEGLRNIDYERQAMRN